MARDNNVSGDISDRLDDNDDGWPGCLGFSIYLGSAIVILSGAIYLASSFWSGDKVVRDDLNRNSKIEEYIEKDGKKFYSVIDGREAGSYLENAAVEKEK